MPDRFTEVTTTGYGKRVTNSFGGIIFGIILFFASFVVLYNNEGSVDYSEIAKTAVEIDAATTITDPALNDKLLVTNGSLITTETLDDGQFLKPGSYLALERDTEMYAWVETEKTTSQDNTGGSQTSSTTYSYDKKWTDSPKESSDFRYPEGHSNPSLPIQSQEYKVGNATIGIYGVDMQSVTLPGMTSLVLNSENTELKQLDFPVLIPATVPVVPAVPVAAAVPAVQPVTTPTPAGQPAVSPTNESQLVNGQYIYISRTVGSSFNAPQVGDVRISYKVLKSDTKVTLFGKLNDKTFGPYLDKNNNRFYQIFVGSKEDAITSLHQSYVMWKWIVRGVGFLMMWIGLGMILGPIQMIANFLPILGQISGSLIGLITFVVALVLSGVTILVAMVFHNVVALVIAIFIVIAVVFFVLKNKGGGSSAGPGPGQPQGPGGLPPSTPTKPAMP
jgi:hypothetical protein